MIAPACIYDQELTIGAELTRIHDPTITRGYYLTSVASLNYSSFRLASVLGFFPEGQYAAALYRQRQQAAGFRKGDSGFDASRGQHGHAFARCQHRALLARRGAAGRRRRTVGLWLGSRDLPLLGAKPGTPGHFLVELGDQVAEIGHALAYLGRGLAHLRQFRLALGQRLALGLLQSRQPQARVIEPRGLGAQLFTLGA